VHVSCNKDDWQQSVTNWADGSLLLHPGLAPSRSYSECTTMQLQEAGAKIINMTSNYLGHHLPIDNCSFNFQSFTWTDCAKCGSTIQHPPWYHLKLTLYKGLHSKEAQESPFTILIGRRVSCMTCETRHSEVTTIQYDINTNAVMGCH